MNRSKHPPGIALLMALLVVTLLTILVIEFTYSTEVDAELTRHSLSATQARYLARGGVALAELALEIDAVEKMKNPPTRPPVETLEDLWVLPFPPRPLGEGVGSAGYTIDDESARFNINSLVRDSGTDPVALEARKMLFQGVLAALGMNVNLLFPLLDWLDADDQVTAQSGAEAAYYSKLPVPYLPRNGRMLDFDEIRLVKGFGDLTRQELRALRAFVTVLPNEELRIDVNTASEPLLVAMLAAVDDVAAAKAIVARRERQPFLSVADLDEIPGWRQIPQQVRAIFDVRSHYFTVHGLGVAADVSQGVAVLEERSGAKLKMLDWRDEAGVASLTSPGPLGGMTSPRP